MVVAYISAPRLSPFHAYVAHEMPQVRFMAALSRRLLAFESLLYGVCLVAHLFQGFTR